jgi:hypothetical protein
MKCPRCKTTKEHLQFLVNVANVGEEEEGFAEVNVICNKCDEKQTELEQKKALTSKCVNGKKHKFAISYTKHRDWTGESIYYHYKVVTCENPLCKLREEIYKEKV